MTTVSESGKIIWAKWNVRERGGVDVATYGEAGDSAGRWKP
ncbi:MAG TPA: hypothetical protein VLC48_01170 [Gemmatimonadota bacterium]|nr:hypothetical protein [Gemmatimonadota bacterium]